MNADTKAATRAHYEAQAAQAVAPRMFTSVSCSQCGNEFPGVMRDAGFSACSEHRAPEDHKALMARLFPFKPWSPPRSEADDDRAYDIHQGRIDDRDYEASL